MQLDLTSIILGLFSTIQAIIIAFLSYNQYTKNKTTDEKLKKIEDDKIKAIKNEEARRRKRKDNDAIIFGALYNLLFDLEALRVYIVQPIPLDDRVKLSVYYEAKTDGVEGMKDVIHNLDISSVHTFEQELVENLFIFIDDIDSVKDRYARSLLATYGCSKAAVKRLSDSRHDWCGSIFVEFEGNDVKFNTDEIQKKMHIAANKIQYILPEYQD